MSPEDLDLLEARGVLDPLDREFANFIHELDGGDGQVALAAALASRVLGQGDVCLDLHLWAAQNLSPGHPEPLLRAPSRPVWREALLGSAVVGKPGDFQPLILDADDRLYLYRYWCYEHTLAQALLSRAADPPTLDSERLRAGLARLFPGSGPDYQKLAAAVAVTNRLAVISGGPGTGKTTTLARVLALLLAQEPDLRIRLAAPTGKAAARLQEAVRRSKQQLAGQVDEAILRAIPEEAGTLHRLLGVRGDGMGFRHDAAHPLNLDLLAIDEASMVDLALMARTVAALPARARLILLGDRDQLSSVEAGAVLGELCEDAAGFSASQQAQLAALTGGAPLPQLPGSAPLMDQVTLLEHSYRFAAGGGIGQLAGVINRGDGGSLRALVDTPMEDLRWLSPPAVQPMEAFLEVALQGFDGYLDALKRGADAAGIFAAFGRFQLLSPQRAGEWGVENLNRRLEERIRLQLGATGREWYAGRALMVTRNDYTLRLFNGDVGIVLPDPEQPGQLRACFLHEGGIRTVALSRLPVVEPVFAMTVHKSQGSEFDEVLLVLPGADSSASQSLGRELLYTAVTRARERLVVWGDVAQLVQAVQRRVRRASGLRDRLAGR